MHFHFLGPRGCKSVTWFQGSANYLLNYKVDETNEGEELDDDLSICQKITMKCKLHQLIVGQVQDHIVIIPIFTYYSKFFFPHVVRLID